MDSVSVKKVPGKVRTVFTEKKAPGKVRTVFTVKGTWESENSVYSKRHLVK